MSKYMVFDNETNNHRRYKRTANPFIAENYIVERGWKVRGDARNTWAYFNSKEEVTPIHIPDDVTDLVGFNIKFDLLYEMSVPGGYEVIMNFINRGGRIFCGQYAKYLVTGQLQKYQMCSMDDIIEEYGGRKKIDGIKELWKAGVLTKDIDRDLLTDYLVGTVEEDRNSGDIGNTELIYLGLLKEIEAAGMGEAVRRRMDGLMATTEMEYRGLVVDIERGKQDMAQLMGELADVELRLKEHTAFIPEEVGFNWGSGVHVSCLLFGGTIRYQMQAPYIDESTGEYARKKATESWPLFGGEPVNPSILVDHPAATMNGEIWGVKQKDGSIRWQDTFQSGKKKGEPKTKKVDVPGDIKVKYQDFFFKLDGFTEPDPEWKGSLTDGMGGPVYSTGKDTVAVLATREVAFLKDFTRKAALDKELGTYYAKYDPKKKEYVGMLTCVNPHDRIVHHNLNHCNTVTTRLSSSDPNLQNIPRGDKSTVKAMFVSRFVEHGKMVEIDYSQLEVVVQGLLSGDRQLIADLNAKIDFHCKRVAKQFNITYEEAVVMCKDETHPEFKLWKTRRTKAKNFSFQRAYGAGAAAIAASTGMDVEDVKQLIAIEEALYPGITEFNDAVAAEINHTAEPFRDPERGWRQYRRGTYQAPTGTLYSFRSWDAPEFMRKQGITDTFSPPEMKNYPVQGTGGELVQMIAGLLMRHFYKSQNYNNKAFMVNTVHDCFWFDCHEDVYMDVARNAMTIMQNIPAFLKHFFNIDCPVPFPAEAEAGPNMLDLHHIHF